MIQRSFPYTDSKFPVLLLLAGEVRYVMLRYGEALKSSMRRMLGLPKEKGAELF
jgi:hypothetical protein